MKTTKALRTKGKAAAIILAGGSGLRFGTGNGSKQLTLIGGIPAVIRSVRTFEESPLVDEIILVVPAGAAAEYESLLRRYNAGKLRQIVVGGETRQQSARLGCDAVSDSMAYMAIHDAARCLVTQEMIDAVFAAAYRTGAAIAAQPARDTVKTAERHRLIAGTVDRENAWYAQTPQVFRSNLYRAAAYVAERDGFEATDDASLAEHIGQPVELVDCGSRNLKLTYPEDVAVAEAILRFQEENR